MKWLPSILAIAVVIALSGAVLACPMCKESVPASDAQAAGGVPSGFNNSIFLMLGGLFAVMGFIAFTVIKGIRSASPSAPAQGSPAS